MKNLSSFEAFKLNKVQMNEVKGGVTCYVRFGDDVITLNVAPGIDKEDAENIVHKAYRDLADSVSCAG